jgi:biofilm protein TabA
VIIGNLRLQGIASFLPPAIRAMLEHLASADLQSLPGGKAFFPGLDPEEAYFLVQRYDSRDPAECSPERHRRFVALQLVAAGVEAIGWAPYSPGCVVRAPYDPGKDVELYLEAAGERFIPVHAGEYMILGTDDVHRPCCRIEDPEPVLKIVGKLRAELFGI